MIEIDSEQLRPFDVDGTLIVHMKPDSFMGEEDDFVQVPDRIKGGIIEFRINKPMVRLLLEEHARGGFIMVWSRGGKTWAKDVITALGIADKVHLVSAKPVVYFDDVEVSEWMQDRVYIGPDQPYKK